MASEVSAFFEAWQADWQNMKCRYQLSSVPSAHSTRPS